MYLNDDTKKDIQSWKFVVPSDMAAKMNNFLNLEHLIDYVHNPKIDFNKVKIAIHYDQIENQDQEDFYYDSESDNNLETQVLNLQIDSAYSDEMQMSVLGFLQFNFPNNKDEIIMALTDFNER